MCSRSTFTSRSDSVDRCGDGLAAALGTLEHRHAHRQLALGDELAVGQDARPLDHVAQLAHVAGPRRRAEQPLGARRQPDQRLLQPLGRIAHEGRREIRNVLAALAQRRQVHLDDVEAVVEIAAEPAGGDLGAQIAVGRGDHVDVDAARLERADALDLAELEHAQQLRLHRQRQLADLVEEQRAAVGVLEQARLVVRWRR